MQWRTDSEVSTLSPRVNILVIENKHANKINIRCNNFNAEIINKDGVENIMTALDWLVQHLI